MAMRYHLVLVEFDEENNDTAIMNMSDLDVPAGAVLCDGMGAIANWRRHHSKRGLAKTLI
jgi:hypothetical protein